jgi:phosphatidylglycerol---prolipoprotein diacylglyceryl transferase
VRRVLIEWCGVKLYSYPVMLYLGTLTGICAGTYAAWLNGLNPGRVYLAMLLLFPVGLVGARLLFVISHWPLYRREPGRIWRQSEGGASLYGGLILFFLLSLPLLKILRIPSGSFWDVASITLLLGMIFTKVGCLLNGCCGGKPTSGTLALYLPNTQGIWARRVPTQLLEAGWAALVLLGLVALWNRLPFAGGLFLYTVAAYSLGRGWLESTRDDIEKVGDLSLHRTIALVLVGACLGGFVLMWPR